MRSLIEKLNFILLKRRISRASRAGFPLPEHVGIIPDGNRRWAEQHHLPVAEGHRQGYAKVKELLDWALEAGIRIISFYAFSTENFNRKPEEVQNLMDIFASGCQELAKDEKIHKNQVRVHFIGNRELLSSQLVEIIQNLEDATRNYEKMHLNLAIAYGGRDEIVRLMRGLAEKAQNGELNPTDITEDLIGQSLDTGGQKDPDLIIRTSNERRISGFLTWQSSYSELIFQAPFFPAYKKADFFAALSEYQIRQRRFGK